MSGDKDHHDHDHDEHDGCLCDVEHDDNLTTHDEDLPPAVGGVEGDVKVRRARKTRGETK